MNYMENQLDIYQAHSILERYAYNQAIVDLLTSTDWKAESLGRELEKAERMLEIIEPQAAEIRLAGIF